MTIELKAKWTEHGPVVTMQVGPPDEPEHQRDVEFIVDTKAPQSILRPDILDDLNLIEVGPYTFNDGEKTMRTTVHSASIRYEDDIIDTSQPLAKWKPVHGEGLIGKDILERVVLVQEPVESLGIPVKLNGWVSGQIKDIRVSLDIGPATDLSASKPKTVTRQCVIDTCGQRGIVVLDVVNSLGLAPVGTPMKFVSVGHWQECDRYKISLWDGDHCLAPSLDFGGKTPIGGAHLLIGQDFLARCRLEYDGPNGAITLDFS